MNVNLPVVPAPARGVVERTAQVALLVVMLWLGVTSLVPPGGIAFFLMPGDVIDPIAGLDDPEARKNLARRGRGRKGRGRRRQQEMVESLDMVEDDSFDLEEWSTHVYDWKPDGESQVLDDNLKPVNETIESGVGDCEDYSAVVTSYFWAQGEDVTLVALYDFDGPYGGHVAVQHGDDIYSNGIVYEDTTIGQYADIKGYDIWVSRDAPVPDDW